MRRNVLFAAVLAFPLLMVSCQVEEMEEVRPEGIHRVTVRADYETVKTAFSGSAGSYTTQWGNGDRILVSEILNGYVQESVESNVLDATVKRAEFTVDFLTSAPEVDGSDELRYLATSMSTCYLSSDWESGERMLSLDMPTSQTILPGDTPTTPNRIPIGSDLLVSQLVAADSRPATLSFSFARVGTIVKINLSGLPAGAEIVSGSWSTGDSFTATSGMGAEMSSAYYYPATGKYIIRGGEKRVAFSSDPLSPVVADASGNATILLRTFAGSITDWFEFFVTVDTGAGTAVYSKYVNLAAAGRTLEFRESGVTEFSLALKPAQAEDLPDVMYTTLESANHDGFMAVWTRGSHVDHYECYYSYESYGVDPEPVITRIPLEVSVIDAESGTLGAIVPSGLAADTYTLHVKGVPDADSGPRDGGFMEVEMYVGTPVQLELVGNASLLSETEGVGQYLVHNRPTWAYVNEYAYFLGVNVAWGTYYGDSLKASSRSTGWWFRTSEFQGELTELTFNLKKWYDSDYIPGKVYGLDDALNETDLTGTARETVSSYSYTYDLSGFAGVKVVGYGDTVMERLFLSYYK